MKYVSVAGVAMVLGLSQCQRDNFSHPRLMVVHETVQVGRGVSYVPVVDKVVGVVSVVWWRGRAHSRVVMWDAGRGWSTLAVPW